MDEIYTSVKKGLIMLSFGLLIAEGNKIIAYTIGKGVKAVIDIYKKVKLITENIEKIYTDGNSCYDAAFKEIHVHHLLEISVGKTKTHMIEATNSSIRDNLSRFNRKSKRYSKSMKMLDDTLLLFFYYKKFNGGFYGNIK